MHFFLFLACFSLFFLYFFKNLLTKQKCGCIIVAIEKGCDEDGRFECIQRADGWCESEADISLPITSEPED